MIPQSIVNAVEILYRQGVRKAVISPGSRSAPITITFARHPGIDCFVIPDERAAAFIALGLAQASRLPVVVVSTSGTAALNLAPALAEAYYRHIPLIAFTADRPPEWVDQMESQTIRQSNVFNNYTLGSYSLPVNDAHPDAKWHSNRIISEAVNLSMGSNGPVHINVPIREPFYPHPNEQPIADVSIQVIHKIKPPKRLSDNELLKFFQKLISFKKILIIAGQYHPDKALNETLNQVSSSQYIPVIGEITSNMSANIQNAELIVRQNTYPHELKPDLLITFGGAIISKKLKSFIRNNKPGKHWHITVDDHSPDTFQSLTDVITIHPGTFFKKYANLTTEIQPGRKDYYKLWAGHDKSIADRLKSFINKQPFCDWIAIKTILEQLPEQIVLHLANSMSVRYADLSYSFVNTNEWGVFCNRGTSGIDGCTSTAVGHAIADDRPQVLITGDMAFFYDRNGLWHKYMPSNLHIVIINNRGGGIFRLIDGSSEQPELETYFEAGQSLTAERIAADHGLMYSRCSDIDSLKLELDKLFVNRTASHILEVFTDSKTNQVVFNKLKSLLLY